MMYIALAMSIIRSVELDGTEGRFLSERVNASDLVVIASPLESVVHLNIEGVGSKK